MSEIPELRVILAFVTDPSSKISNLMVGAPLKVSVGRILNGRLKGSIPPLSIRGTHPGG